MSPLIISLPLTAASPTSVYAFTQGQSGTSAHLRSASATLLPDTGRSTDVVAVVPAQALSWLEVDMPAGKPLRGDALRAALVGSLEDRVLDDPAALHFALQPLWQTGHRNAVAVCNKAWLQGHLQALEAAGRPVNRIVPALHPARTKDDAQLRVTGTPQDAWLWVCEPTGVWGLPVSPAHAAWTASVLEAAYPLSAEPAVAEMAAQALQRQPSLVQPAQRLMQAAQSEWDLAQFDLAATGSARWVKAWVRLQQALWQSPAWRPARWGIAVLLICQVLGLNAWAWKLQSDLHTRQSGLVQIMKQTFPDIQVVVDAPLQMAREVQGLRQAAGQTSRDGLEPLLASLGQALPAGQAINALDFQSGQLRIKNLNLSDAESSQLQTRLQTMGLNARREGPLWLITGQGTP
jgi:general secretion pathway protein L